jgi:hypothetical protein
LTVSQLLGAFKLWTFYFNKIRDNFVRLTGLAIELWAVGDRRDIFVKGYWRI